MNGDLVRQRLEAISDVGKGSAALRQLLLKLAFQGKLVHQNPEDQPASEWLSSIELKKDQLIQEGQIKKRASLIPIQEDAEPHDLPASWQWCRLGEITTVASSSRVHKKDWRGSGIPFYRAREIVILSKFGTVNNELFIDVELFKDLSESGYVPEPNDLMITGVGTIGTPYVVRESDRFYFKDASVLILKNFFGINPKFLYYFCKSPYWIEKIHEKSMGTTVHTLTISRANDVPVPLPPLAEQKRIVTKVDELMALIDDFEDKQKRRNTVRRKFQTAALDALVKAEGPEELGEAWGRVSESWQPLVRHSDDVIALRKTIASLACRGLLVHQDKTEGNSQAELVQCARERQKLISHGVISGYKNARPVNNADVPFSVPDNWCWSRLQDVFAFITDGDHQAPPRADNGIPFLVISDVRWGEINFTGTRQVPNEYYKALTWGRRPTSGDLLYTVTGSYGIPIIVKSNQPFCVQRHIAILKSCEKQIPSYWHLVLASSFCYQQATECATGIAQKTVPLSGLRNFLVPVPPLAEQIRIVAKVDQLMKICDELEASLQKKEELGNRLAEAVVAVA